MAVLEQAQIKELKPTPEAEALFRRWIGQLNDEFTRGTGAERRSELVRDELYQIYLGRPHGVRLISTLSSEAASSVLAETLDPRNITMEHEYREDIDWSQYGPRKPLIYFWRMFDRSALGLNHWLGVRVRCMLGQHIFAGMGKGVKIHTGVQFTYGYNLRIEDNVRVHTGALLDDRNELVIPAGTIVKPGEKLGQQ
jgi:hypothetical protein